MTKILVVDDNRIFHRILGVLLEKSCNHDVFSAFDGQQGLDVLETTQGIELIICDYEMPNMDGYEFTEAVRKNPLYSGLPIIGVGDFPEDKRAHLTEFRQKPFTYLELNEIIEKYCA